MMVVHDPETKMTYANCGPYRFAVRGTEKGLALETLLKEVRRQAMEDARANVLRHLGVDTLIKAAIEDLRDELIIPGD